MVSISAWQSACAALPKRYRCWPYFAIAKSAETFCRTPAPHEDSSALAALQARKLIVQAVESEKCPAKQVAEEVRLGVLPS